LYSALLFDKPCVSSFSSFCSPAVLRFTQVKRICRCFPCYAAPPRRISTPLIRSIESPWGPASVAIAGGFLLVS
jgi:hypothetical protein